MDLNGTIRELQAQLERIDKTIAQLETLDSSGAATPRSRRGRKSMPEAERREVSERMKRYWASRRRARA